MCYFTQAAHFTRLGIADMITDYGQKIAPGFHKSHIGHINIEAMFYSFNVCVLKLTPLMKCTQNFA